MAERLVCPLMITDPITGSSIDLCAILRKYIIFDELPIFNFLLLYGKQLCEVGALSTAIQVFEQVAEYRELFAYDDLITGFGFSGGPGLMASFGAVAGAVGGAGFSSVGPGNGGTFRTSDLPRGFLWKPTSESNGNLVVLTPTSINGGFVKLTEPDGKTSNGRFSARGNGDRDHYRFGKPGRAYAPGTIIEFPGKKYTLIDGSQRIEGTG